MKTVIQIYAWFFRNEPTSIEVPEDVAVFLRLAGIISEDIAHYAQYPDAQYIRHQVEPEEFEQLIEQFELDTSTIKGQRYSNITDQSFKLQKLLAGLGRHWDGDDIIFTDELEMDGGLPPRADTVNRVWPDDDHYVSAVPQYWQLFEGEDPLKEMHEAVEYGMYWEFDETPKD